MTTPYLPYTTQDGDRWDLISWDMYGTPFLFELIIKANPYVPITPTLPGGITLRIPLREPETVQPTSLPPWKRP